MHNTRYIRLIGSCLPTKRFNAAAAWNATRTMSSTGANKPNATGKDWSSAQYLKFNSERTRAARDLLSQIPLASPKHVVDIGCGPGNSTAVVAERYPNAHLSGIDSSPDMIKKAQETLPEISFKVADLESYAPEVPADLYFSNAVFQWLSASHLPRILQRLVGQLPPGGVLAFQVPDNLSEPCQAAMRDTASESGAPWEETLRRAAPGRDPFPTEGELYDTLRPLCSDVDIWRTTYYHRMDDHQAIVEWVKGTGLRPFIDPLSSAERQAYLDSYLEKIKNQYPIQQDGKVLLAYPRLFVVATKA